MFCINLSAWRASKRTSRLLFLAGIVCLILTVSAGSLWSMPFPQTQGQGSQGASDLKRQSALSKRNNSLVKNAAGVKSDSAHRNTVALFFVFCVLFLATAVLIYVSLRIFFQWKRGDG